jgi:autotransporter-associated beta strand protein
VTVNGVIYGNSDVNSSNSSGGGGSGNVTLNAQNTYTGATMIDFTGNVSGGAQGGIVALGTNNALPVTTDVIFGAIGGLKNAQLDLEGYNQQVASLSAGADGDASGYTITDYNAFTASTLTVSGAVTPARPFGGTIADGFGQLSLIKAGPNTLELTGANNYSGGTTVNGGVLLLGGTNSPTGSGGVMVTGGTLGGIASLGVLNVTGGGVMAGLPGQPGTLHVGGNAAFNAGTSADFNFGSGSLSVLNIDNSLTLPSSGTVTINLTNDGGLTSGSFTMIRFGNLTNTFSMGQLAIGAAPSGATYGLSENGNEIDLTITPSNSAAMTVTGGSTTWSAGLMTSPSCTVTLDSTSSAASTIALNGNQSAAGLVFNVSSSGGVTLTPGSGGSLILGASAGTSIAASGSGGVTISAPVVLAGDLAVSLADGSTLQLGDVNEGATVGALDLTGNGQLILGGSGSFSGGVTVEGGTLTLASTNALEVGTSLTVGAGAASIFTAGPASGSLGTMIGSSADGSVAVPEPGTLVLLAAGAALAALAALRRRKN